MALLLHRGVLALPVTHRYKSCPRYTHGHRLTYSKCYNHRNLRDFTMHWINSWCYYLPTKIIPPPCTQGLSCSFAVYDMSAVLECKDSDNYWNKEEITDIFLKYLQWQYCQVCQYQVRDMCQVPGTWYIQKDLSRKMLSHSRESRELRKV